MTEINFIINEDHGGEVLKAVYSKILSWAKPQEKTAPSVSPLAGYADRAAGKNEASIELETAYSDYIPVGQR